MPDDHHHDHPADDANTPNRSQIPFPPHAAPPPLPPETYNYLIHALLSLQGHAYPQNYPPTYPYPVPPSFSLPWPPATVPPISTASIAAPLSFYPTNPQCAGSSQPAPSSAASPTPSAAQDPEEAEDATSITEDKRRRNTAASARFRVKKKLKAISLERTVADLTGRTEELEREAIDLRRENAWLKEIVLLKGRNLAALHLGPQAPASRGEDDAESEPESTARRREKGKDKES